MPHEACSHGWPDILTRPQKVGRTHSWSAGHRIIAAIRPDEKGLTGKSKQEILGAEQGDMTVRLSPVVGAGSLGSRL